ncbi:MAG: hypothetical protein ABSB13_04035 [Candidatus Binatus sp.]
MTEIYRVEVHHCRGAQESAVPINSSTDHTRLLTPAAIAAVILNETSNAIAKSVILNETSNAIAKSVILNEASNATA